jgi:hypothetical protein
VDFNVIFEFFEVDLGVGDIYSLEGNGFITLKGNALGLRGEGGR